MNVPLFKIYNDENDVNNLTKEIQSGKFWAVGPKVEEFENKISNYIGSKFTSTFNSGTSALHALLLAHGIGHNDEVIVPSYTFIATANAPLFVNAKPVFADIEYETCGLNPVSVEENITDKTKAIITVHYGGCPSKLKQLREIADDNDLILIEDAAEAFGATIDNKKIGTFGDSSILSFCQNKVITTGEGGAVVTDNEEINEKLKLIRSHGRLENGDYFSSHDLFQYICLGYNWRMSNLTATLGISQLNKVDTIINLRKKQAEYYTKRLNEECGDITTFDVPKGYNHVYQLYSVLAENRNELIKYLGKNNISSKIYFDPIHLSPFYKDTLKYNCKLPVTEEIAKKTITLPMFPSITNEEIDYIVDTISKFYGGI